MAELYKLVPFDELQEGEPVLAFGVHVVNWDFGTMGEPAYAFCPTDVFTEQVDQTRTAALEMEDILNTILQPGMYWIELLGEYKAAGENGVEWYEENGPRLELAHQRLIEALKAAAKKMPPK